MSSHATSRGVSSASRLIEILSDVGRSADDQHLAIFCEMALDAIRIAHHDPKRLKAESEQRRLERRQKIALAWLYAVFLPFLDEFSALDAQTLRRQFTRILRKSIAPHLLPVLDAVAEHEPKAIARAVLPLCEEESGEPEEE